MSRVSRWVMVICLWGLLAWPALGQGVDDVQVDKMAGVWKSSSGVNVKVFPSSDNKTFAIYVYANGAVTDIVDGEMHAWDADGSGSFDFSYTNKDGTFILGHYRAQSDTVDLEARSGWKATWKRLE